MESMILSAEYSDTMRHKPVHFHDCHQLLYIAEGTVLITVSGKTYRASPGTAVLISRFEEHSIQVESDLYRRYTLHISPESARPDPLLSLLVNRPGNFRHAVILGTDSGAEQLLERIVYEHQSADPMGEKMLDLLFLQLLITIYRAHPEMIPNIENELQLIRQIQQQFEEDYRTAYTLQELSRQYHISQSYLSHLFKQVTGTSVMGYLASCRYAAAKRYLAETDLEIGRIVELCGFSDNSNFSRSFKSITGMTPSDFRSHYRQNP